MLILNLGCGVNRRRLYNEPFPDDAVHIDRNPEVRPTVVWDLEKGLPLRVPSFFTGEMVVLGNNVDEIHAYHLIEHIGRMGETDVWFRFWRSCWNALRPGGTMFVDAPWYLHEDAIGDPTHTRLICLQTFHFLDRRSYLKKDGDNGCAQSKLDIDFDFERTETTWLKKDLRDPIPCGIRVQLKARKTEQGELLPIEELKKPLMEAAAR